MKIRKLTALVLVAAMLCAMGVFDTAGLAAGQSPLTVDLTGSKAVSVPTEVISTLTECASDIVTSEGGLTAFDVNRDGKPDISVTFQQDGISVLKRLAGADLLTRNYTFDLGWGPYSQIVFKLIEPVTGVKLNKSALSLAVGESEALTATVEPKNATNQEVIWASSDDAVAKVSGGGKVTAVAPGTATVTVTTMDGGRTAACVVTVKAKAELKEVIIVAEDATYVVKEKKNYTFTLEDVKGNPVKKVQVSLKVNGKIYYKKTNANGVASFTLKFAKPGKYSVVVNFAGNKSYKAASEKVVITVAKQAAKNPTKIVAGKKTFKAKVKIKKYSCTLKTKNNKPVKKAKITLKVGGKTYAAKTNSKGKATFKINKLTKKGKYTATIKYAGNGTYKAATKKVRIVVK